MASDDTPARVAAIRDSVERVRMYLDSKVPSLGRARISLSTDTPMLDDLRNLLARCDALEGGAGGTDRDRWMAFLAEFNINPHRGMEADVLYWHIGDTVVKLEFDDAEKFTGVSTLE